MYRALPAARVRTAARARVEVALVVVEHVGEDRRRVRRQSDPRHLPLVARRDVAIGLTVWPVIGGSGGDSHGVAVTDASIEHHLRVRHDARRKALDDVEGLLA